MVFTKETQNQDLSDTTSHLNNKGGEVNSMEELFNLTAASSFYREHKGSKIGPKQILSSEIEPITRHLKVHNDCTAMMSEFFNGEINLETLICKLHSQLIQKSRTIPYPGNLRKSMVVITKDTNPLNNRINNADFICPNYDKIKEGLEVIEKRFKGKIEKAQNDNEIMQACGELHYLIAVLHPFSDGNGRIARMISLTALEYLNIPDVLGFTFFSENYKENTDGTVYNTLFHTKKAENFTNMLKIHSQGKSEKTKNGEKIPGIDNISMQDYINGLDLEKPVKKFEQILTKLKIVNPLLVDFSKIVRYMKEHGMTKKKSCFKFLDVFLKEVLIQISKGEDAKTIKITIAPTEIWNKKEIQQLSQLEFLTFYRTLSFIQNLPYFEIQSLNHFEEMLDSFLKIKNTKENIKQKITTVF